MALLTEPNDTLTSAVGVTLPPVGDDPIVLAGEIGDTTDLSADVDLVTFDLQPGDLVAIETRTPDDGDLDTVLRLFGPGGDGLAFNDDRPGSLDSRITFIAPVAGTYAAGVSSFGNAAYDPQMASSGDPGSGTGSYDLALSLVVPPLIRSELFEPNDTIAEAADVTAEFMTAGVVTLNGFIGDNPDVSGVNDVDLVTIALTSGESVRVTAEDAGGGAGFLSPTVRVFSSAGTELPIQPFGDGAIGFSAPFDDDFVVGVSDFDNRLYDPTVEGSGSDGFDTGFYRLAIAPLDLELDLVEPDDTLALAPDLTASLVAQDRLVLRGLIGDDPDLIFAADDVDLVSFTLDEGDRLELSVDGEFLSGLDAVLRVFGPGGEELAISDDAIGFDPEIIFEVPAVGAYTIGISAASNVSYDPEFEDSGADGFSTGLYDLIVELSTAPEPGPILGTPGDDVLEGASGPDLIRGLAGDDLLLGRQGNDELRGGPGDDEARGGGGDDVVRGGSGDDVLRGGAGDDLLRGGPGNDILRGGAGSNFLIGDPGSDTFVLSGEDDEVRAFDVLGDPSERTFDTVVFGPGLVLRSERDFFELALSERAGYDLDLEADDRGVIRRVDIENARTGEVIDIEIADDDMTLTDFVLYQAEQIGLLLV